MVSTERLHMASFKELARVGLERSDINIIVNSHRHFDHCGNDALFPGATILAQHEELATARRRGTRYTVAQWFDYDAPTIQPVRGDLELCKGVAVLATPGHTPGHQSVLVYRRGTRTLIAAQAAFNAQEFTRGGDPDTQAYDGLQHEYSESIGRLKSFGAQEVYFSHSRMLACAQPTPRLGR